MRWLFLHLILFSFAFSSVLNAGYVHNTCMKFLRKFKPMTSAISIHEYQNYEMENAIWDDNFFELLKKLNPDHRPHLAQEFSSETKSLVDAFNRLTPDYVKLQKIAEDKGLTLTNLDVYAFYNNAAYEVLNQIQKLRLSLDQKSDSRKLRKLERILDILNSQLINRIGTYVYGSIDGSSFANDKLKEPFNLKERLAASKILEVRSYLIGFFTEALVSLYVPGGAYRHNFKLEHLLKNENVIAHEFKNAQDPLQVKETLRNLPHHDLVIGADLAFTVLDKTTWVEIKNKRFRDYSPEQVAKLFEDYRYYASAHNLESLTGQKKRAFEHFKREWRKYDDDAYDMKNLARLSKIVQELKINVEVVLLSVYPVPPYWQKMLKEGGVTIMAPEYLSH